MTEALPCGAEFVDPAADFQDGLQVIFDYHGQLMSCADRLAELGDEVAQQGFNVERSQQARHLQVFLSNAIVLHHRDEEECLFEMLEGRYELVDHMMKQLMQDHRDIEDTWIKLMDQLQRPDTVGDHQAFGQLADRYTRWLRQHIELENERFLPEVVKCLNAEERAELGARMAGLRQA